jgi:hypothetical protein
MQNGRRYRSLFRYHVFRSAASSPAIKKPYVMHIVSVQFMSELVYSKSGFRLNMNTLYLHLFLVLLFSETPRITDSQTDGIIP